MTMARAAMYVLLDDRIKDRVRGCILLITTERFHNPLMTAIKED